MSDDNPSSQITLLDITNQIYEYFVDNTLFTQSEFEGINIPDGYESLKEGMIIGALDELERTGLIRQIAEYTWIRSVPFGVEGQDVHLSPQICSGIAGVINTYLKANNLGADKCNAMNIDETDIASLLQIIAQIISNDPPEQG